MNQTVFSIRMKPNECEFGLIYLLKIIDRIRLSSTDAIFIKSDSIVFLNRFNHAQSSSIGLYKLFLKESNYIFNPNQSE